MFPSCSITQCTNTCLSNKGYQRVYTQAILLFFFSFTNGYGFENISKYNLKQRIKSWRKTCNILVLVCNTQSYDLNYGSLNDTSLIYCILYFKAVLWTHADIKKASENHRELENIKTAGSYIYIPCENSTKKDSDLAMYDFGCVGKWYSIYLKCMLQYFFLFLLFLPHTWVILRYECLQKQYTESDKSFFIVLYYLVDKQIRNKQSVNQETLNRCSRWFANNLNPDENALQFNDVFGSQFMEVLKVCSNI